MTAAVLSSSSLCRGGHLWFFFSFSRLLLFYSLSLSLFHLPCPKVFSPSGPFYCSFSPLFLLCSPLFCLLLLLLMVFSAVNNVLPSLQRLRGGAGGGRPGVAWMVVDRGWLGWWSVAVEPGDNSCSFFFFPVQRCPPLVFFLSFHVCFHSTLCHCLCFISLVPKSSLLLVCFTPVSLFSFSSVRPCFVFSFCC